MILEFILFVKIMNKQNIMFYLHTHVPIQKKENKCDKQICVEAHWHRWLIIHYSECSALVYLFLSGKGMASNKSISLLLAPVTLLLV